MPVYSYRCESCGFQFDQSQKFTDESLTKCPECGRKSLRKVYSAVGIVFKGSGFYATDHRSPSGMNRTGSGSEEKSASEKSSESGSSETKQSDSGSSEKKAPATAVEPAATAKAENKE